MNGSVAEGVRLTKSYRLGRTEVPAVRSVSLAVAPGELMALAGPSGSGKTTVLNLLGCLDRPDTGEVWLGGQQVSKLPAGKVTAARRERVGFVFQSFNLVPVLSAFENVEFPLLLAGVGRRQRRQRVTALLARVGLEDKASRRPDELSGGERQRVAIARALVNRPALVLADEPTANLDSATGASVLDLMDELRSREGAAFVVASHDPRVLERVDRVLWLRDGAVVDAVVDGVEVAMRAAPARAAGGRA